MNDYKLKYTVDLMAGKYKIESFATDDHAKLRDKLIQKRILNNNLTLKITKN